MYRTQNPGCGLHFPELIERIFHYCKPRQLLVSVQLVCTQWHDVVNSRYQGQTYLRPDWTRSRTSRKISPMLRAAFGDTLLDHKAGRFGGTSFGSKTFVKLKLPIANMKNDRRRHLVFTRTDASWRRMLVSQPPPTSFKYKIRGSNADEVQESRTAYCPDGLRMGLLYDRCLISSGWIMAGY